MVLFINENLITKDNYSSNKTYNNKCKIPIKQKTEIKLKGYQKQESRVIRRHIFGNLKMNNTDNSDINGSIGNVAPDEDQKLSSITKNMILVLIDSEKIKKKTNLPLNANNNKFNKYYLLNLEWFLSYIKLYNLNELYTKLNNNKIIENLVNKDYIL
jgi:hypothetical protein